MTLVNSTKRTQEDTKDEIEVDRAWF